MALPPGVEAISFLGTPLKQMPLYEDSEQTYLEKKSIYEKSPELVENIIWFGRWAAYCGKFKEAISIYSRGIAKFPNEARLYRHRGHRYISIRELDKAIEDLKYAASLMEGKNDEVEPDGQPNKLGLPTSTLKSNIYYHLGLALYLQKNFEDAAIAYEKGIKVSSTSDMLVAFPHWYYLTLKRLDQTKKAGIALNNIALEMDIIENEVYHVLCLLYKKCLEPDDLIDGKYSHLSNEALAYGISAWSLNNRDTTTAVQLMEEVLEGGNWASFGYIASEVELAAKR